MRFCSCDERTRVRKLRKQIYKKCVCAIHYIVHYTCTKNGNEYLMGCFVFSFNYIKSNSALCHCFLFFPDCFFQTINFSFIELYPDVWQIYPGRKKKKKKECSHSTVAAGKVLFQVIDSCLEVLQWKQYKTEQLSCSILFYEAWFCADLFYVDVKLICCLFSLHIIHNDNHPMNISFTWVITNLGNCVERQPRSLLHAVIWTCLNIQNTKSTHPWTKSWLNGLTIMHNEELLITYSE